MAIWTYDCDRSKLFLSDVDVASANDVITFFAADQSLSVDALLRRQKCVWRKSDFRSESETLRQVEGLRRFDWAERVDSSAKKVNLEFEELTIWTIWHFNDLNDLTI